MSIIKKLTEMRDFGGKCQTIGLTEAVIHRFAAKDKTLVEAVNDAYLEFKTLKFNSLELLTLDESDQVKSLQSGIVNFYHESALNPYVTLAARGPWVITSKGAVIHDNGGYGMLGFGHAPSKVLRAMARNQVMANVMTANFSQLKLVKALKNEVGHQSGACPFEGFLFLNSGSESVSAAARISDINAKIVTDTAGAHAGKKIKQLSLKGGFHGRTDRPARFSDSTQSAYRKYLASFRDQNDLLTVAPNDLKQLQQVFDDAAAEHVFIESMFIEPVMGEGNPGLSINRAFYDLARKLTSQHGALLLVDSIQAGLRAHGCLSIVDYAGFEGIAAPDMETYSKALNAGQYPLSVLAMNSRAAQLYRKGVYGNTMTSNPRAMDVACQVLSELTPALRANIRVKGQEFITKLANLSSEIGGLVTQVQGTGLLISCELRADLKCFGADSVELWLRRHGIGVIHGGQNSLRFTPHFNVTSAEIDLVVSVLKQGLLNAVNEDESYAA